MQNKNRDVEYERVLVMANEAKDRLYRMVCELQEEGYIQKAKSLMTLVYKIEEWQNKG